MKKTMLFILAAILLMSVVGFAHAEAAPEAYDDIPLKEVTLSPDDEGYYAQALEVEVYNYKLVRNVPNAFEAESWKAFTSDASVLAGIAAEDAGKYTKELDKAMASEKNLKQVASIKDTMWFLWEDDNMPMADEAEPEFTADSYDNAGFKPFLHPYLLADQENVKGNIIVIAGGGFDSRNNAVEGYAVSEGFNALGYNCFVLQRRVAPYVRDDALMDMQRAVRYLRYHGEALGLGALDCIAAAGFSGGSGTIMGAVNKYYGDVQPTISDSKYQPDALDAVNSDMDVIFPMYGPSVVENENPNIPPMFIGIGMDDLIIKNDSVMKMVESVGDRALVEVHMFGDIGHGFGPGMEGTTSAHWIPMADTFIQHVMEGKRNVDLYNRVQTYEYNGSPVVCKLSADGTQGYLRVIFRGNEGIITGTVDENGQFNVVSDETGFMAAEAPAIFALANPEAWEYTSIKYDKYQVYEHVAPWGQPVTMTLAATEDGSKFRLTFEAFGDPQILEGTVDNGIVTVTYDLKGMMTQDCQGFYNGADPDGWKPVVR